MAAASVVLLISMIPIEYKKIKENLYLINEVVIFSCRKIIRGADGKFRSINTNLLMEVDNKNGN